jgi:hypothetical protein
MFTLKVKTLIASSLVFAMLADRTPFAIFAFIPLSAMLAHRTPIAFYAQVFLLTVIAISTTVTFFTEVSLYFMFAKRLASTVYAS